MKAELYNIKYWVHESDAKIVRTKIKAMLEQCDFEILGFMEHHFEPQGYTCLWLLGESHLAIHTYPEHNKAYIELTSCVLVKNEKFERLLLKAFRVDV